jgi:hypothetical protein
MEDYRAQQRKICLNCFERGCQGECMAVWSEPGMPERKTFGWPGLFALLAIAFFVVLVVLKIVEGYQ